MFGSLVQNCAGQCLFIGGPHQRQTSWRLATWDENTSYRQLGLVIVTLDLSHFLDSRDDMNPWIHFIRHLPASGRPR